MHQYLNLRLPDDAAMASVKMDDEGIVLDILDEDGEVVASTWKLYDEFGKEVRNARFHETR